MIKLIVTASDELYTQLSDQARAQGYSPQRARDVLQGFERATRLGKAQAHQGPSDVPPKDVLSGIVIDMSLRAADTLLETLHVRQSTSGIPLVAVKCDGKTIPLALRRLCKDIVETHSALPLDGPELGES